ncbi:Annexin A5 [Sporothrix epigloea]|uniref:Annexin A5 n=1 Tax=Sporothrix epigloea TaxID=1892477 RepID=A0ABP0DI80_9PEZI
MLAYKDSLQVDVIRIAYHRLYRRNMVRNFEPVTGSWSECGLVAIFRGALFNGVHIPHQAMSWSGTKELVLIDILLSCSSADLRAIKTLYHRTYHHSLEDAELFYTTESKLGPTEVCVCSILSARNDNQVRSGTFDFRQLAARALEEVKRKEFSG